VKQRGPRRRRHGIGSGEPNFAAQKHVVVATIVCLVLICLCFSLIVRI
jgi:hypothetical protein